MSRKGQSTETESSLVVAGGWAVDHRAWAKRDGVPFQGEENVRQLIEVMVAQVCEETKIH